MKDKFARHFLEIFSCLEYSFTWRQQWTLRIIYAIRDASSVNVIKLFKAKRQYLPKFVVPQTATI